MLDPHLSIKRPPFPLVWDNSMRSSFISCPQKFWWEYGEHFKPKSVSIDLHAGKAWAEGLEVARTIYYEGGNELEAMAYGLTALVKAYGDFEVPKYKENKSLPRLMDAFGYYFKAFPLSTDPVKPWRGPKGTSAPMVEFSFALPIDSEDLLHPETGEPIIYSGRADMVATYAGALSIYDDKTTSQLGPKWGNQWHRRAQFTGYSWAAQQYNIPVTQILVRGIALLKNEVNHAQVISVRTPAHILEWHLQLVRDIKRAIQCWKEGYWDLSLSDACSSFGGCMFLQPCMSPNPTPWLEGNFERRVWDPLKREERVIPIQPI